MNHSVVVNGVRIFERYYLVPLEIKPDASAPADASGVNALHGEFLAFMPHADDEGIVVPAHYADALYAVIENGSCRIEAADAQGARAPLLEFRSMPANMITQDIDRVLLTADRGLLVCAVEHVLADTPAKA